MKFLTVILLLLSSQSFAQQLPIAGCNLQDFVVVNGPTALIRTQGRSYVPRCLKIKAGTQVTIEASSHHPLQGILNNVGAVNPIFNRTGGVIQATAFAFPTAGIYGFFCTVHSDDQGDGMGGAILVEP